MGRGYTAYLRPLASQWKNKVCSLPASSVYFPEILSTMLPPIWVRVNYSSASLNFCLVAYWIIVVEEGPSLKLNSDLNKISGPNLNRGKIFVLLKVLACSVHHPKQMVITKMSPKVKQK